MLQYVTAETLTTETLTTVTLTHRHSYASQMSRVDIGQSYSSRQVSRSRQICSLSMF